MLSQVMTTTTTTTTPSSIPAFTINLDKLPGDRWTEVITHFKDDCLAAINELEGQLRSSLIGNMIHMAVGTIATNYIKGGNILYKDEIASIATLLGVLPEKVLLSQLSYEFHACCSSIVVNVNGTNMFYRTMDWPLDCLKKLTCRLDFMKGDRLLFSSISWAGFIGILTAMVPEKYGLAVNFRASNGNLLGNAKRTMAMSWPAGYLVRHVLENEMDYTKAVLSLQRYPLISPCYFTLCNASGASSIIIRDPDSCVKTITSVGTDPLIQTNKDPGNTTCNILWSQEREALAKKIIAERSQEWKTIDDVLNALTVKPIRNEETVYICGMVPSQGILTCRTV